ncbi:hypothetical protein [Marinomonas pollencensis]|uniref:hypothetical protein n=1 Tax=Marinomonas pollencensis TaxID=491954 RepID=UPI000E285350|nr:hypothetical protein [Marinomonas pollencensis]
MSLPLIADETDLARDEQEKRHQESLEKGSWWQSTHRSVSETVDDWSRNIDAFLSGKQHVLSNESYMRLRFGPILSDDGADGFFDFNARLKLPNTKDRLRFVIESDGDHLTSDNEVTETSRDSSVVNSVANSNVSAAVRYIKKSWGADFDGGVLLAFPLNPFLRTRFSQGQRYGQWRWYQQEEAFAYYTEGTGLRYKLGYAHQLGDDFQYGSRFGTTWFAQDDEIYYREDFFLKQSLNEKSKLLYQLSFLQADGDDTDGNSFLYFVDYSRHLYKNWLIGHVKPQMTHESDNDYQADFSLTLSLEVLFGNPYLGTK